MPLPYRLRSGHSKARQPIDQSGDRDHSCRMLAAVVAIRGRDTLKPSDLPNRLLDHNPKLRKRPIVDDILWGTVFATRFTARRKAVAPQLGQCQIGQIAAQADCIGQAFQQSALLQQRDVGGGSRDADGDIHNAPRVAVHRKLAFECVLFLLARIVAVVVRRTLHPLLKTIHNHGQFRDVLEQIRQLAAGIILNAIEFGSRPKPAGKNFLATLAEQNGGKYVYIDISKRKPAPSRSK